MTIKIKKYLPLFFIFLLAVFFRFYNISWDQGHFLHPDERLYGNASDISLPQNLSSFFSPDSPLNPHMFYYGSFPLYLYKLTNVHILPMLSFDITGRLFSAALSTVSIYLIFLIAKTIFDKKIGIYSAIVFAFSVGSIQHAHFDTTESILVFFLSLITLFSIKLIKTKCYSLIPILGIILGLSYATKIIGLTFAVLPLLTIIYVFKSSKKRFSLAFIIIAFCLLAAAIGLTTNPYQIIDSQNFIKEQTYMQRVTYGQDKPPFAIIYEGTLPYIYPLIKVLPFTFGFLSFPLALLGLFFLVKSYKKKKEIVFLLLLTVFPLFYFAWAGAWFTKFSRYYILLFPFLSIWAGVALSKLPKALRTIAIIIIVLNGALFTRIYFLPHTRIVASDYIYKTVPKKSVITGEHWDDTIPLETDKRASKYTITDLDIYGPDTTQKIKNLSIKLAQSDYFILSSRRVYQSILNNKKTYPRSAGFYEKLFAGKLGFVLEKKITNYPFFFSDDFADESFQSYDHPPVLIFKNKSHLSSSAILKTLYNK